MFDARQARLETDLEHERPTQQEHQRMDHAPQPARRRSHESLLKIAPDELKQERSPLHQVVEELPAGDVRHQDLSISRVAC